MSSLSILYLGRRTCMVFKFDKKRSPSYMNQVNQIKLIWFNFYLYKKNIIYNKKSH